jgi:hypothetical protein
MTGLESRWRLTTYESRIAAAEGRSFRLWYAAVIKVFWMFYDSHSTIVCRGVS